MAKALTDIERDIRELDADQKLELLRSLVADLDGPADENVERAWLETAQRRYKEMVEGNVAGIPGPLVFERLRSYLTR